MVANFVLLLFYWSVIAFSYFYHSCLELLCLLIEAIEIILLTWVRYIFPILLSICTGLIGKFVPLCYVTTSLCSYKDNAHVGKAREFKGVPGLEIGSCGTTFSAYSSQMSQVMKNLYPKRTRQNCRILCAPSPARWRISAHVMI